MALRTVSQKKRKEPFSQEEFVSQVRQLQSQIAQTDDIAFKTVGLWKMESLAFSLVRYSQPGNTLNDPRLPAEALPVMHVGMGEGAVESAKFRADKTIEIMESYSHPKYHLFCYDSLGAMLAVYESMIVPLNRIVLGLPPLRRPDPEQFLAFSPEIRRLISHGYGRLLYFRSKDIGAAARAAMRRPFLQLSASLQGTAFAYAMVNHRDLYRALEAGNGFTEPKLVQAFNHGLIYALEFWEWMSPGFLSSLQPKSAQQSELICAAQKEVEESRSRGALPAFSITDNQL